jgi:hypothetical protein
VTSEAAQSLEIARQHPAAADSSSGVSMALRCRNQEFGSKARPLKRWLFSLRKSDAELHRPSSPTDHYPRPAASRGSFYKGAYAVFDIDCQPLHLSTDAQIGLRS